MAETPETDLDSGDGRKSGGGGGGGMKAFFILLIVLDVVAAGVYGWLALVERPAVETDLKRSRTNLFKVKEQAENIAAAVDRIAQEKQQRVAVLPDLVNAVALQTPLQGGDGKSMADRITCEKGSTNRWLKSSVYDQMTVEVRFKEKTGYSLVDLYGFLERIQKQSPKVQIKAINFGQRDEGNDLWRPLTMTVRAFVPSQKR